MYQKKPDGWLKHWDFMALDFVAFQVAYILAYMSRHGIENLYSNIMYRTIAVVIMLSVICVSLFLSNYRGIIRRGYVQELKASFIQILQVFAVVVFYLFLTQQADGYSRMTIIYSVGYSSVLVYVGRCLWRRYLRTRRYDDRDKSTMILVTSSSDASKLLASINTYEESRNKLVGIVYTDRDGIGEEIDNVPVVSSLENITQYIKDKWIDEIFLSISNPYDENVNHLQEELLLMGITVHTQLSKKELDVNSQVVQKIGGHMVLTSSISMASIRQMLMKRVMDISGAIIGLFVTAVLFVIVAPAIYLQSPGPIFFAQKRVGRNGRIFKIYKFRSMYMDAEERKEELMARNKMRGNMFKVDEDPRIIGSGPEGKKHGIGWFIRKTSIDEFPQFWNVLKGDMSLVGTRPPTLDEWQQYDFHHRVRMATKPGITGMWQISGRSDITDFEEVVALDSEYIKNWKLGLDIKIIFKTVQTVLTGQGAE